MSAVVGSVLFVPFAAGAQSTEADRYRLEKTPGGYVRMDTQTGEMSMCEDRAGELVCRLAADERRAMETEVERLQSEIKNINDRLAGVKALEDRVAALENSLAAKIEQSLPTEEDFNRTMSYMERFFRSFMSIAREFDGDGGKPTQPGANRT
ncbi:MAG: hypothetical protein JNK47_22820 [Mesorhizobium sp.]|nr:hypothetical protein [Mesorhizobium sp.]